MKVFSQRYTKIHRDTQSYFAENKNELSLLIIFTNLAELYIKIISIAF